MVTVRRKDEYKWPMSEPWKHRVRAELDAQGRGAQSRLAEYLGGIDPGQITDILKPEAKNSSLVPGIHRYLGWPEPELVMPPSEDRDGLVAALRSVSDDDLNLVARLLRMLGGEYGDSTAAAVRALIALADGDKDRT
jgi:hypothetical protein